MKKIMMIFAVVNFILITSTFMFAESVTDKKEEATEKAVIKNDSPFIDYTKISKYIAASLCIAGATISSGLAVGKIGSAAMGAVSEKPEAAGTAMILAALAEGVCLWGIAGAFLILVF